MRGYYCFLRQPTSSVIAEGRIRTLEQAQAAARAGVCCVVAGFAITRTEHVTTWFRDALAQIYAPAPVVLAADLGGTKTMVSLVQAEEILDMTIFPTDRQSSGKGLQASIVGMTAPWKGSYISAGMVVTGVVCNGNWCTMNRATLDTGGESPLAARKQPRFWGALSLLRMMRMLLLGANIGLRPITRILYS